MCTPSGRKGALVPCIDTRIVDAHRHPPLNVIHESSEFSAHQKQTLANVISIRIATLQTFQPATHCPHPKNDVTKLIKRKENDKFTGTKKAFNVCHGK